jgi:gluconate kinase
VLIGAPGTGKSSVLERLATLLEINGVSFGALESEQLAWGVPLLGAEDWIAQLEALLALQQRTGRRLFLLAATVEDEQELRSLLEAIPAQRVLVACLSAPEDMVAERLQARESDAWPGKGRLIEHARRLSRTTPRFEGIDLLLDTAAQTEGQVADAVLAAMREGGLLSES